MDSRRRLLKIGVVSAASFLITACTKAVSGSSAQSSEPVVEDTQTPSTPEQNQSQGGQVVIAQVSALVAGEGFNFTAIDGTDAILFKTKDEKVYALSRICTHEGCSVDFDLAQNKLICPCHGATYEALDGNVISGPTQRSLKKINVKIDGDNVLEVI
jgi:Rieske Fe-S protein